MKEKLRLLIAGSRRKTNMELLKLDDRSFCFDSLGLKFEFFMFEEHLCIKIIETSDKGTSTEEEFVIVDVTSVSNTLNSEDPIDIKDEHSNALGYLVIGKNKSTAVSKMPSLRTAATLYFHLLDQMSSNAATDDTDTDTDTDTETETEVEVSVGFESSFIIEDRSVLFVLNHCFLKYKEAYMQGSDLWGGFSHRKMEIIEHSESSSINAIPNIRFPTEAHKNKAFYATSSDNSFTRFLSKYQIIELMFDYITVARIRVSQDNLFEFRDIMNAYGRDDIVLLKSILKSYVLDISKLSELMYEFASFEDTTIEIFQKHSKDSNPLKDEVTFGKFWEAIKSKKLTYADINANSELKFTSLPKLDKGGEEKFATAIVNIVAYWIYRVRCSIAHNKIGEHIFSDKDESFILEAAEPILDEVLRQLLTNPDLQELLMKSKQLEVHLDSLAQ